MSTSWKCFFSALVAAIALPFTCDADIRVVRAPQGRGPVIASAAQALTGRFLSDSLQISEIHADDFPLTVSTPRSAEGDVYAIGEEFSIQCGIATGQSCHINLFSLGTRGNLVRLFPNQWAPDSLASGKTPLTIPPRKAKFAMKTGEPPGTDLILAVAVSGDESAMQKAQARATGPFAVFEDLASAADMIREWTSPEPGKRVSIRPLAIHTRGSEPGEGAFAVARHGDWVARVWVDRSTLSSGQPLFLKVLSNQPAQISSVAFQSSTASAALLPSEVSSIPVNARHLLVLPRHDDLWIWEVKGPSATGTLVVDFTTTGSKTMSLELPLKLEGEKPGLPVTFAASPISGKISGTSSDSTSLPASFSTSPHAIVTDQGATSPTIPLSSGISSLPTPHPLPTPVPAPAPRRISLVAFFEAARQGNRERLQAALQSEPWLVETRGERRATALHWAASEGQSEAVALLASAGAWVNAPAEGAMRPLHLAAWRGHAAVVRQLLGMDAALNPRNSFQETPLLMAVKERRVDAVRELLAHKALPNLSDTNGSTPLDWALLNQDEPIAGLLTAAGAKKSGDRTSHKVHGLAMEGNLEGLREELIREPNAVNLADNKGRTALHLAALHGHKALVDLLLTSSSQPDQMDDEACTALHLAASQGQGEMVQSLLKSGATPSLPNAALRTPIHSLVLAESSEKQILECLAAFPPMAQAITTLDEDGNLPLHLAIRQNLPEAFQALQRHAGLTGQSTAEGLSIAGLIARHAGKEFLSVLPGIPGFTATATVLLRRLRLPLLAAENGNQTILEFLLRAYSEPVPAADGSSLLHAAVRSGHSRVMALALQHQKSIDVFDAEGNTPLHLAAARGDGEAVSALLAAGGNPLTMNGDGLNALQLAAVSGSTEVLAHLLKGGIPINVRSSTGDTALHLAAEAGNAEFVEHLLAAGIGRDLKDSKGRTALTRARTAGFDDIAGFLEKGGKN